MNASLPLGSYINLNSSINNGECNFIVSKAAGTGGFTFHNVSSNTVSSAVLLTTINSSSNILSNNIDANNKSNITALQTQMNTVNIALTNISYSSETTNFSSNNITTTGNITSNNLTVSQQITTSKFKYQQEQHDVYKITTIGVNIASGYYRYIYTNNGFLINLSNAQDEGKVLTIISNTSANIQVVCNDGVWGFYNRSTQSYNYYYEMSPYQTLNLIVIKSTVETYPGGGAYVDKYLYVPF